MESSQRQVCLKFSFGNLLEFLWRYIGLVFCLALFIQSQVICSFRTTLCLQYEPHHIASGVFFHTSDLHGTDLQSHGEGMCKALNTTSGQIKGVYCFFPLKLMTLVSIDFVASVFFNIIFRFQILLDKLGSFMWKSLFLNA